MEKEKKTITFQLRHRVSGPAFAAVKKTFMGVSPETLQRVYHDDKMPHKIIKFTKGWAVFKEDEDYYNRETGEMILAEEFVKELYKQNRDWFNSGYVRIVEDRWSRQLMIDLGLPVKNIEEVFVPEKETKYSRGAQTAKAITPSPKGAGRAAFVAAKEQDQEEIENK